MAYCVPVGEMRTSMRLQRVRLTDDDSGGDTTEWEDVGTLRVKMTMKNGGERTQHQAVAAYRTFLLEGRWTFLVRASDRLMYCGRVFNIRSVENVEERGIYMKIMVEERVAG